jgi:hypothetical protein
MPTLSKDKEREFIGYIRKIIVAKPDATSAQVCRVLEENGYKLHYTYVNQLINKIRRERAIRYENSAVMTALAEFEDFIKSTSEELSKIASTSKLDMARIIALDTRVKHYNMLLDKQFDAGVFNRKLGVIETKYTNVAKILKLIKDERSQQRKQIKSADSGGGTDEHRESAS